MLAAGAGSRFGGPKALAREPDQITWLSLAVRMLRDAGCEEVLVTLGAASEEAIALVPSGAQVVVVDRWADGLSASIRAGIAAASALPADAVLITPVDTPGAPAAAARRVCERAFAAASPSAALARAVYFGVPGHPVLIGRDHWAGLTEALTGDTGAAAYLARSGALNVDCADLWSGQDLDRR